ncbi:MAG TPA: lysyl oxidase family protein, partial [Kofleriaceae bacterium]|nr:lysyl oxidase family protein [Kofleriaceae bacterium]
FSHYANFAFGSLPGEKRAFCLESTNRFFNSETTPWAHPFGCDNQGIETGWGDDYIAGIECQWIDVTSAGAGTQNLTSLSNPDRFICEGTPVLDSSGNLMWEPTSFVTETGLPVDRPLCTFPTGALDNNFASQAVPLTASGGYILNACTRGQTGPVRDCGWHETPVRTCTPGSTVNLTCKQKKSTDPLQVVRACEASAVLGGTSCPYVEALSNKVVEGNTTVSFTCPAARDASEPGGRYSLYFASAVDGDPAATVTCN